MRKLKVYLKFFWFPLLLSVIAATLWLYIPGELSNFKSGLMATVLGVGISIFAAEGYKKLNEYKRVKKTLGFLKLVTVPYIKNQSENIMETTKQYQDITSIAEAPSFLMLVAHFDAVSANFDKSWLQLIYSQDFIDAINSDDQFNRIANTILEILLFIKTLTALSINAKSILTNDFTKLTKEQTDYFLKRTREIRNDLSESAQKLEKYTDKLNDEIERFFSNNGVKYEEFDR